MSSTKMAAITEMVLGTPGQVYATNPHGCWFKNVTFIRPTSSWSRGAGARPLSDPVTVQRSPRFILTTLTDRVEPTTRRL